MEKHHPRDAHRISADYRGAQVRQKMYVLNEDGSFHCVAHQVLTRTELKMMLDNIDIQLETEAQDKLFD